LVVAGVSIKAVRRSVNGSQAAAHNATEDINELDRFCLSIDHD
jgi:hypothetical protein